VRFGDDQAATGEAAGSDHATGQREHPVDNAEIRMGDQPYLHDCHVPASGIEERYVGHRGLE
jgi:hypothetical protein